MAEGAVKAPKNLLSLGFDSHEHEVLLTHLHRKEKLAFAVCPEPLPVPTAQNMFH